MLLKDEISAMNHGASFKRADIHIHSYGKGGSDDVTDEVLTPRNIVETAISNNLDVISITDHNSIGNVEEAMEFAESCKLLVLPGVEISTTQGHLLLYFSTYRNLSDFFGKLTFNSDRSYCNQGIVDCLQIAQRFQGIGIAAHIEIDAGFLSSIPKDNPIKDEVLKQKNLLGLEIANKDNFDWFSDDDENDYRKNLFNIRKECLRLDDDYQIAKIMTSDAHTLEKLGKNASGDKKVTRFKMDELSFDSFKIALLDPISRVRIEELIPKSIPYFYGLKIEGGFLNKQVVKFSKNLTCIIGGRGAGKSTLFESVRVGSGNTSTSQLLDCEVWPDKIELLFRDETGREQIFVKEKFNDIINITNPTDGIIKVFIESYGQGETASKIQNCDKNPKILLSFFDEFIDFDDLKTQVENIRNKIIDNQTAIENLNLEVKSIPEIQKLKNNADEKVRVLKEKNVGDLVKYEENLIKGQEFRKDLIDDLKKLIEKAKESLSEKSLIEEILQLDDSTLIVGKEQFKQIKNIVSDFSDKIDSLSDELDEETKTVIEKLRTLLKEWKDDEVDLLKKMDEKRKELEEKGITFDIAFIRKVTRDASNYKMKLDRLKKLEIQLSNTLKERKLLLNQRKVIKSNIYNKRQAWATLINRSLKNTVIDFQIKIKYSEGKFSNDFESFIKEIMGWRTSQVPRTKILSTQYSPLDLLNLVNTKKLNTLSNLKDENDSKIFSTSEIQILTESLNKQENLFRLENIQFEDFPEISVTKKIEEGSGEQYITRDFTKLSLGQQQSILLTIMLYSKSNYPLIIDQPEDNLDSEFIYKTIVKNLKQIKESRQVIIVTHNANIAVLGDAELIIPLRSTSERAHIMGRGSIDSEETKKITCEILEGGDIAFKKRMEIYNLHNLGS